MKLKKNNGFAGIDITISMIIFLIFIPTVCGIFYNIQKNDNMVKRKGTAINIATNVLEIAKSEKYEDITLDEGKFTNDVSAKYAISNYQTTEEEGYNYKYYSFIDENESHYQIQIGLKNCYPENIEEEKKEDLIKKIKVVVYYPVGNKEKNIDISMIIQNT